MIALSEDEFKTKAEKAYITVFAKGDPYDKPFNPGINPRLLLYSYRWRLHEPWVDPVVKTLRENGEQGFFVTALERPKPETPGQYYHWYVPINEATTYGQVVFSQQNAVYSTSGLWGIICSDEDHALVGGLKLLIDNIKTSVPDIDERVIGFLQDWKKKNRQNNIDISWIFPLLSHVYGNNKAKKYIRRADFGSLSL
jgi:hypothetical protein